MYLFTTIQGELLNMAVFFWYLGKSDLSVQLRTLDKSHFSRYQKSTAMFNWSPCTYMQRYRLMSMMN